MIHIIVEAIKKQRIVWSWAVVVGLFLVVMGHAPILPVLGGCALAIAYTTWRSASNAKFKPTPVRGGR